MKDCPNCNSSFIFDANMCVKCGWRPYHSLLDGKTGFFPLDKQNFKLAIIISSISSCLFLILYLSPLLYRKESVSENVMILGVAINITLVLIFLIWQTRLIYKYLHNFYHPLDNIFLNLRWSIASVMLLSLLVGCGLMFEPMQGVEGGLLFFLIGLYVLWAFMQILIGWSLIKADHYDYVGGTSALGYAIFASGIIPVFLIFTSIFSLNLFIKAYKYDKRLSATDKV